MAHRDYTLDDLFDHFNRVRIAARRRRCPITAWIAEQRAAGASVNQVLDGLMTQFGPQLCRDVMLNVARFNGPEVVDEVQERWAIAITMYPAHEARPVIEALIREDWTAIGSGARSVLLHRLMEIHPDPESYLAWAALAGRLGPSS